MLFESFFIVVVNIDRQLVSYEFVVVVVLAVANDVY